MPRDQRWLETHLQRLAWLAVAAFIGTFVLFDIGFMVWLSNPVQRLVLRWLLIGGVCAWLTLGVSRRTIQQVARLVHRERAARRVAEALADLAATVTAGDTLADTLSAAVTSAAGLFGGQVRCAVALADATGELRMVACNAAASPFAASVVFAPGDGFLGRAFSERRVVRIDNIRAATDAGSDVNPAPDINSLLIAPLVADQRTLGVMAAASPDPGAFDEQSEQVLVSVARQVAVAILAARAQTAAQGEAAKKAAIVEQMDDAVLVADGDRRIVECNRAAAELFDIRAEDLTGLVASAVPWQLFGADGQPVPTRRGPLNRAVDGERVDGEYRLLTPSGIERSVWATATPLRAADGSLSGAILVLRDIAEWRRAESALRETEERYRRLVELCPDPIVVQCEGSIVYANAAALHMAGADSSEGLVGRRMLDFVHPDFHASVTEHTRTTLEGGDGHGLAETTLKRLDGELIQIEATTMPISYEGRPAIQAVVRDVTVRKRAEAALAHQALHDALTGLPNRVLLLDRLQQAIRTAQRDGAGLGLLLMDLDHFKEVNDTLGHHAGDLLLQQVGTRLRGALRQGDTVARLGGDEFAVILPSTDPAGVIRVVENLLRTLQTAFAVEDQPVVVGASIGVALAPEHGTTADTLMQRADVAMYVAKRGSAGYAVYQAEQDRSSPDRLSLIGELRRAIDHGELVLHYQPKIDLSSGALAGVEALVRWEHPTRGLLAPDQFIQVAEQAGLIEPLSRWVFRSALAQVSAWRRIGFEVPVAVNLSMRNLHDEQLPAMLGELLRVARVPTGLLGLEIMESMLVADPARTLAILRRLREMGIRVALDDFGTGHSSLACLRRLPIDEVKIDRSFVKDIATDAADRAIIRSTIGLAHNLGLHVVAEGVEDATTVRILAELGCDEGQGFHLSPPLRGHDLTRWLDDQPIRRAA